MKNTDFTKHNPFRFKNGVYVLAMVLLIVATISGCAFQSDTPESTQPSSPTSDAVSTDPTESTAEEPTSPSTLPTEPPPQPLQIYTLPQEAESPTQVASDALIFTHDEGTYGWQDAYNSYSFKYRIPSIAPISYSAIEVQREINERFQTLHDEQVTNIEGRYSPFVLSLTYEAYCAKGVLSIVLTETCDWEKTNYYVYNLDIGTGKRLNDTQLLNKLEIDEDEFVTATKKAAEEAYVQHNGPVDSSYDSTYSQEQLDMTLSIENIAAAQLFVDNDGKLMAAMDIYSIAGANSYTRLLELEP